MEKDQDAVDSAKARLDSVRKEAASEAQPRGAPRPWRTRMAMQGLMSTTAVPQAAPARRARKEAGAPAGAAGGYRASQEQNYAQQVRVVGGRAFYQNGNVWTDSSAQQQRGIAQSAGAIRQRRVLRAVEEDPGPRPRGLPWAATSTSSSTGCW